MWLAITIMVVASGAYLSGLVFYPDQTNAFCETVTGRVHRFMKKDHKKEFKKKNSKKNPFSRGPSSDESTL
ncbi:Hypp6356 [Branchiostoma lanceolatum]|uniref:Hypp6356 protein n=1 Tax=Branchiostoma lanceolatum TaxID=7740 RepID=A0A8J9YTI5_BRALA|nr:Hypp6356 [Branchiostoma lanceolatum]